MYSHEFQALMHVLKLQFVLSFLELFLESKYLRYFHTTKYQRETELYSELKYNRLFPNTVIPRLTSDPAKEFFG
jgi:hypothetical protein